LILFILIVITWIKLGRSRFDINSRNYKINEHNISLKNKSLKR
jgi:hypothetical protein